MKLNNLALPHPVLGHANDVSGEVDIIDQEIEIAEDDYSIKFKIQHENGTIKDYVNSGKAVYCCEVLCSGTLYREIFTSDETSFSFNISRINLRNRVDFQIYCVAAVTIGNYNNPGAHTDYDGFSFELAKGDLLAFFGGFDFNADIEYHRLKAASSFMEILPHTGDEDLTNYVWESKKKIQIWLPKKTYDKFKMDSIGKRADFAEIVHASLVQNALIIALYNFDKAIEMGDCVWAESIKYRLLNEPELNHGSEKIVYENIPHLVQKLLGKPNDRLVDRLERITKLNEIEE
jgi:hypothetical protein